MQLLVKVCIIKPGKPLNAEYMMARKYIVKWILSNESLHMKISNESLRRPLALLM